MKNYAVTGFERGVENVGINSNPKSYKPTY